MFSLSSKPIIAVAIVALLSPAAHSLTASSSFSTKTANSESLFALNIRCKVRPEIRDEWLKQIQEDRLCSRRDEPECLQFVLGRDVDDENAFYLFELYRNQNAFQEHCRSPHFQAYTHFVETKQPYAEEIKLCLYHPMEEADGTTKRPIHKNSFGLNVNLYPKAVAREDFLKVISDNKKGTDTTEPLALQYTYGEATNAPGEPELEGNKPFHFHEEYSGDNHGKEGFDAHASAPHFAAWEEFVATDPFDKPPEVFFFHILEP